ncbi:P-loop NTPase [Methanococcus maripaludis]|uniref:Flp pilus assembly protein TadD n=1 Tax=Methanococcus maripaludis TaxID=39152 RepID=A0A7J9S2E0_METMI|nr:tetratricopeptide repeat protein [Methanococcus maripaludis]MBB6067860.1 Flp pilus assembly protein TadD [Methanococcus maripaludis]
MPIPVCSFFIGCYHYVKSKNSDPAKIIYEMEKLLEEFKNGELNETIHSELMKYLPKELDQDLSEIKTQILDFEIKIQKILENSKKCGLIHLEKKISWGYSKDLDLENEKRSYYKGIRSTSWEPIIHRWDVRREQTEIVLNKLNNKSEGILILGDSGEGKTQFINRIAYELSVSGWLVLYRIDTINIEQAFENLSEISTKKLIVIDDASNLTKTELGNLLQYKPKNIKLLIADQSAKWNSAFGNQTNHLKEKNIDILKLKTTKKDIECCFETLEYPWNENLRDSIYTKSSKYNLPWIITFLAIYQNINKEQNLIKNSDMINNLFEDIYNQFNSNRDLLDAILPIFAVGYYGAYYPKEVYDNIEPINSFKLKILEDTGYLKINDSFISTYHPYIINNVLLKYYSKNQFFNIFKKYYLDLLDNISKPEQMHDGNGNLLFNIGQNLIIENNPEKLNLAAKFFEKIVELEPKNSGAHNNLGVINMNQKEHYGAMANFKKAVLLNNNDAEAHSNMGVTYFELGKAEFDYEKLNLALDEFKTALEINSGLIGTLKMLGRLYLDLDDPINAETILKKALQSAQEDNEILTNLGCSYRKQHKYEQALTELRKVDPTFEKYYATLYNMAEIYFEMGIKNNAEQYYNKAYTLNPNSPELNNALGLFEISRGNTNMAEIYFKNAVELNSSNYELLNNLILCYWENNKFDEAKDELKKFLDVVPNIAKNLAITINTKPFSLVSGLANIALSKNRTEEAVLLLKKATKLSPNYSVGFFNLAIAQKNMDLPEYKENLKKAHELFIREDNRKGLELLDNFLNSIK